MGLAFLADENVEMAIAEVLRGLGHDVIHVGNSDPGSEDEIVLSDALRQGHILLTNDKDFGELVFRHRQPSAGVILIRLPGRNPAAKADVVAGAVKHYGEQLWGGFLVIGEHAMRMRRLPE